MSADIATSGQYFSPTKLRMDYMLTSIMQVYRQPLKAIPSIFIFDP